MEKFTEERIRLTNCIYELEEQAEAIKKKIIEAEAELETLEVKEEATRIVEEVFLPFFQEMETECPKRGLFKKEPILLVIKVSAWKAKNWNSFSVQVSSPNLAVVSKSESYENTEIEPMRVWEMVKKIASEYGISVLKTKERKGLYFCKAIL